MGAPKQKWTSEEEAALKAGVIKHGAGKWRTILKDPEFSRILYLRSNVDLKDKWRNMSVMAHGWNSREKPKISVKRVHHAKLEETSNPIPLNSALQSDEDTSDAKSSKSIVVANPAMQIALHPRKKGSVRLDNLIMEAISTLREPGGSSKTSIAGYIEDQYWSPHDFKRILSAKLKYLTANGKLIKYKRKYSIAHSFLDRKRNPSMLYLEGRPRISPKVERDDFNMLTKSQIDVELAKMRTMTAQEAAIAAAQAVAEAEAAIAEAEEAAMEAEAAEADADAAQAFAEAAMKTLKGKHLPKMMFRA